MKVFSVLLGFQMATLLALGQPPALPLNDEARMENLILNSFTDVGGTEVQERLENARQELGTRPEFKPLLLAKLQREYFEARNAPGKEGDVTALSILALRSDLTATELKPITDELERRIHQLDSDFNFVAVGMLKHYPSSDHEALVLRFLELNEGDWSHIKAAFRTLHEIGGVKSLAVMKQIVARKSAQNPKLIYLEEMNQLIGSLGYRLKHPSDKSVNTRANSLPEGEAGKSKVGEIAGNSPSVERAENNDLLAWLGIIGGLLLVIIISTNKHWRHGKIGGNG